MFILAESATQRGNHQKGPGKRQQQQNGNEEIERPWMTVNRGREAFDVLIDKENLDELPAVHDRTNHKPGYRDRGRDPKSPGTPRPPLVKSSTQREESCKRERRQQHGDGTLGKNSETHGGVEGIEPEAAARRLVVVTKEEEHERGRETHGQKHVHRRCTGESKETDRTHQYQRCYKTSGPIPEPPPAKVNEKYRDSGSECGRKSRSNFIDAEELVAERGHPVHQYGLFEPRNSI